LQPAVGLKLRSKARMRLLVRHNNLGLILHRFRDIAVFCAHDPTPIPQYNSGVFPLDQIADVGVNVSRYLKRAGTVKLF